MLTSHDITITLAIPRPQAPSYQTIHEATRQALSLIHPSPCYQCYEPSQLTNRHPIPPLSGGAPMSSSLPTLEGEMPLMPTTSQHVPPYYSAQRIVSAHSPMSSSLSCASAAVASTAPMLRMP